MTTDEEIVAPGLRSKMAADTRYHSADGAWPSVALGEPPTQRRSRRAQVWQWSLVQTAMQYAYSAPLWMVVRPRRFMTPSDHPALVDLAARSDAIVAECESLLRTRDLDAMQVADPAQSRLNHDDRWKALFFRIYGREIEDPRRLAPILSTYLDEHPDIVTAMVSVLEPGKRILVHPGPMKGVLRVHLGVEVPSGPGCFLWVGGRRARWERGRLLVFDDTYLHYARNGEAQRRSILFFDLVRPMPWPWLDRLNRRVISTLGRTDRVGNIADQASRLPHTQFDASA